MEFAQGLKIVKDLKDCSQRHLFCDGLCEECELNHKTSDETEALQMAVFALQQVIETMEKAKETE